MPRFAAYLTGSLALSVFVVAALAIVPLWLITAFLLDVVDGGPLA